MKEAKMPSALEVWSKLAPGPRPLAGLKWNVFHSYRSVNRAWVINLYDVLREHGHQVFLDQCTIAAGDQLTRTLERALEASQAGVLIWSSAAADSDWVRDEYEVMDRRAKEGGFTFVPVRLDAAKLPPFAANRVFLDFSQYPDGPNGGELLKLLHAVVGQALSVDAVRFAEQQDETARVFNAQIKAAVRNGQPDQLERLFAMGGLAWETSSALGCATAEGLTKLKGYDQALAMLAIIEARFPRSIRPKQLKALALARRGGIGDLQSAQAILGGLYELGERDPETLGIYARTWMDRFEVSKNALHLHESRNLYAEAFEAAQDDYYTGINAAAKSVFIGTPEDLKRGQEFAKRVEALVGKASINGNYWKTATVGETQLILGNYAAAAEMYSAALAMAPEEHGSHETTWKQACRLMTCLQPDAASRMRLRAVFAHLPECP